MAAPFVSTRHLSVVLEVEVAVVDSVVAVEVVVEVMVCILSFLSVLFPFLFSPVYPGHRLTSMSLGGGRGGGGFGPSFSQ